MFDYFDTVCILSGVVAGAAITWGLKGNAAVVNYLKYRHIEKNKLKLVLVARNDLGMSKGKIAAQCCHAALSCYIHASENNAEIVKQWEDVGMPTVVVKYKEASAVTATGLKDLSKKASSLGITAKIIKDAGRTQVAPNTVTALGLGPHYSSVLDSVSGNLKVL